MKRQKSWSEVPKAQEKRTEQIFGVDNVRKRQGGKFEIFSARGMGLLPHSSRSISAAFQSGRLKTWREGGNTGSGAGKTRGQGGG